MVNLLYFFQLVKSLILKINFIFCARKTDFTFCEFSIPHIQIKPVVFLLFPNTAKPELFQSVKHICVYRILYHASVISLNTFAWMKTREKKSLLIYFFFLKINYNLLIVSHTLFTHTDQFTHMLQKFYCRSRLLSKRFVYICSCRPT